jgi:hypothetical protein
MRILAAQAINAWADEVSFTIDHTNAFKLSQHACPSSSFGCFLCKAIRGIEIEDLLRLISHILVRET